MEEPRRLGGRYELGQVLGRGGMAEVHLAHDTRLGRTVAVKTLRADLARDPSFQARFRREAQSAASLNHPAIVAVYDTGEDYIDGISIPYIVMEYVDGSTLRELLHSGRKLLPERSMEMTIGILQALEYSHRNNIVHRDIKPANVMLTRTGQVKVMDFGIARAMGDAGMTMTQTSAVIGTAQYLSPEQAKGETVDARSDLYSTGCLLYELLTVRPPFIGDSPVAVAYQHVREEAQPPSVFDPEITPEMDAIVLKALVKDPDYRYQSADEMRADIEACLDGQPVAATAAMGAVGYGGGYPGGYGDEQATTALRPQDNAAPTTMLPPVPAGGDGYDYDDRPGRRRQKKNGASTVLLAVAGVLVLVGAILIGKWLSSDTEADPIKVPNLVGEKLSVAEERVDNARLKSTVTRKPCEDQPKDNVCAQDPAPGTEVDENEVITLTVSTGAPKVAVPNVIGDDIEAATDRLEEKGYDFKVETEFKQSEEPVGSVLDQDPSSGTEVEKGSTITLTVAKARERVAVPDLAGQTCDAAKQQLQDNNLVGTCTEVESSEVEAGKVLAQSPTAGTPVVPGSTVSVQIAKAPPEEEEEEEEQPQQVQVPQVMNKTLGQVKQELAAAGLQLGGVGGPKDDNAMVVAANPLPGTQVPANTAVSVQTMPGQPSGTPGGGDGDGDNDEIGFFGGSFGGRRY
ncbi:Stk1 family PASTA domain-containing Ser/Thr kinase [Streptomyces sp. LE64]|uniref:Stk1 family PASTA domain-containing Ser/Thr kinase n=1 Tax=unclassified Streptomyces TaxID=2593676 RepID=UPI003329721E